MQRGNAWMLRRTSFGLEDGTLLVTLGHIYGSLCVQELLAAVALGLHLQLKLSLDVTVRRLKVLDLEPSARYTPFLYNGPYVSSLLCSQSKRE